MDGVTRTNSYCGLEGQLEFATCNVIIGCFEDNDNIYDWNVCTEDQVEHKGSLRMTPPSIETLAYAAKESATSP